MKSLNILNKSLEDLKYLLKATNKTFDAIVINESRIIKDSNLFKNINIHNYSTEFTPTDSHVGGTFTLVTNYVISLDKIFVFINIKWVRVNIYWNNKSHPKNVIIGCIYKHLAIYFNILNNYLNIP